MITEFRLTIDKKQRLDVGQEIGLVVSEGETEISFSLGSSALLTARVDSKLSRESFVAVEGCGAVLFDGFLLNANGVSPKDLLSDPRGKDAEYISSVLSGYRGSFRGFFILDGALCLFTDHLGNYPLYYYEDESLLCCSGSVFEIARELEGRGALRLSLAGAYSMLTYAYMLEDFTLFEGVRRLEPGAVLSWSFPLCNQDLAGRGGASTLIRYHQIERPSVLASRNEAIETIDELFLQAVKRQSDFNMAHGLPDHCALSAGLDSRMTAFALRRLGVERIKCFTYSESFQDDCIIPMKICHDCGWEWVFKNLDNGWDLLDIDEAVNISNGTNYYLWASQLNGYLKMSNTDAMGLIHTGVLGDVIVGSFAKTKEQACRMYRIGDGAYSKKLIHKLSDVVGIHDGVPYEEGMIRNRGINGAALGYTYSFSRVACASSPFMDIDFFDYCLGLPTEMRLGHSLYYDWVTDFYVDATRYPHNGVKIASSDAPSFRLGGRSIAFRRIPGLIKNKIRAMRGASSMNPFDLWYQGNCEIQRCYADYYESNRLVLSQYPELLKDASDLFETGNALERALVLSLLGSLSIFESFSG